MAKVLLNHPRNWSFQVHENSSGSRFNKVPRLGYSVPCSRTLFVHSQFNNFHGRTMHYRAVFSRALNDDGDQGDVDEDGTSDEQSSQSDTNEVKNESFREGLERIVGNDDSTFTGVDLATLIRNKYGRSYDVTLIKKEFMGRNLLAMNVMWKYVEQRSFPLTEEEYLLRLDDVANNLRCWGAVSHIRNSLAKMKDRPRIGKAVSIFIDMDESGGRANEWIYK